MSKKLRWIYYILLYFVFLLMLVVGTLVYLSRQAADEGLFARCGAVHKEFFGHVAWPLALLALLAAMLIRQYAWKMPGSLRRNLLQSGLLAALIFAFLYILVFLMDFFLDITGMHMAHQCRMRISVSHLLNILFVPLFAVTLLALGRSPQSPHKPALEKSSR